jgi:hypothetical protein
VWIHRRKQAPPNSTHSPTFPTPTTESHRRASSLPAACLQAAGQHVCPAASQQHTAELQDLTRRRTTGLPRRRLESCIHALTTECSPRRRPWPSPSRRPRPAPRCLVGRSKTHWCPGFPPWSSRRGQAPAPRRRWQAHALPRLPSCRKPPAHLFLPRRRLYPEPLPSPLPAVPELREYMPPCY